MPGHSWARSGHMPTLAAGAKVIWFTTFRELCEFEEENFPNVECGVKPSVEGEK